MRYAYPGDPDYEGGDYPNPVEAPTVAKTGGDYTYYGTTAGGDVLYQDANGNLFTQNASGGFDPWSPATNTSSTTTPPGSLPTPPDATTPTPTPPPPSVGGGGGGGGGPLIDPWTEVFNAPAWDPTPDAPTFTFGNFTAPTYQEATDDPGFKFVQQQGQLGVERSAAARGLLNTGGTLQDIARWNQGLADTQYGNVYNRNLNTYQANRQTALDAFTPLMDAWRVNAARIQHDNDMRYANAYQQYRDRYQRWLDRINTSININNL